MKCKDELLLDINEIITDKAYICGGALRSYIEGDLPRDIDIFMHTSNIQKYEDLCEELYETFGDVVETNWFEIADNLKMKGNYYAFEFMHYDGDVAITIITPQLFYGRKSYGTLHSLTSEIDFNVCRLGLDYDNNIYCPDNLEETLKNIRNKEMKLINIRAEEELDRTQKRIKKYQSYGYTLI